MPSFFFHIIFDVDTSPSSGDSRSLHENGRLSRELESEEKAPHNGCGATSGSTKSPRLSQDWRYDKVLVQDFNMAPAPKDKGGGEGSGHITNGISAGPGGLATKGRYEPLDPLEEELGWGVVRLYRDFDETPGLYDGPEPHKSSKHGKHNPRKMQENGISFREEDCTTLCILAVPSYLTPSDFLGFVGEKTRDEVSHFRMVRTERGNRYMVLMKFRDGRKAREWRKEWNGRSFDGMEVSSFGPVMENLSLIYSCLAREPSCRLHQVRRLTPTRARWPRGFVSRYDKRPVYSLNQESEPAQFYSVEPSSSPPLFKL